MLSSDIGSPEWLKNKLVDIKNGLCKFSDVRKEMENKFKSNLAEGLIESEPEFIYTKPPVE